MVGVTRRLNAFLSAAFPEKRIVFLSPDTDDGGAVVRPLTITPLTQLLGASALLLTLGWAAYGTAVVVVERAGLAGETSQTVALKEAFHTRIEELASERDQREAEARSAQQQFQLAMEQVSRQQTALLQSVEERHELSAALDAMRGRLDAVEAERDTASAAQAATVADAAGSGTDPGASQALQEVSEALSEVVVARDEANAERVALQAQVNDLELRLTVNRKRQQEMVQQVHEAVATSIGPLEKMFADSKIDIDSLLAEVQTDYVGEGGPAGPLTVSTRSYDDPETMDDVQVLVRDLDKVNMLRISATKVPLAYPVLDAYRMTSPFGGRSDPFGRGHRRHEGIDMAAPRGTPIYATADGVVETAGVESGYGNVVRIRHAAGYETVYGHLSKIRVQTGQQVSRGARVGDMGSTGRSTGNHLHYEVRVNGQPQNPMTYLEAAKDVF